MHEIDKMSGKLQEKHRGCQKLEVRGKTFASLGWFCLAFTPIRSHYMSELLHVIYRITTFQPFLFISIYDDYVLALKSLFFSPKVIYMWEICTMKGQLPAVPACTVTPCTDSITGLLWQWWKICVHLFIMDLCVFSSKDGGETVHRKSKLRMTSERSGLTHRSLIFEATCTSRTLTRAWWTNWPISLLIFDYCRFIGISMLADKCQCKNAKIHLRSPKAPVYSSEVQIQNSPSLTPAWCVNWMNCISIENPLLVGYSINQTVCDGKQSVFGPVYTWK